ncbi:hypothetical protein Ae331Ps2_6319 [Pseudonocardia sp. Ae331_Ps2]|nr:hypothetical protein Ae331Ps2_6319 [Pseudonocardia sp. Ae331_Ps2]
MQTRPGVALSGAVDLLWLVLLSVVAAIWLLVNRRAFMSGWGSCNVTATTARAVGTRER